MLQARCYCLAPLLFFFGLQMQKFPCPGRGTPPSQTLTPLGRFAPSQITIKDMEIYVISRGARSLIIKMNVSETACSKLDVIVLPPAIWRKSYSSNLCSKYMHQKLGFFRAQNFPCPGRPSPCSVALLPRSSPRRLLLETWKYKSFPEALAH